MSALRFLAGLLLVPVCVAATRTVAALVQSLRPASLAALPPPAWALLAGFGFWLFLYATLPRPVRTYVLAHELTHALWGWLMGSRVSRLRVSADGGSVTLSKTNVWITLAPYFFPFYTMLTIAGYGVLSLFFNVQAYALFWLGLVGFTWGFHFTFTLSTLARHQSDVLLYGRLFSYTLIYLLNIVGIAFWIVAVSGATLDAWAAFTARDMRWVFQAVADRIP
ncbi:MAG: hypothetical protein JW951_09955 [Lentisphaerae bacterium]|nr:hypothetical protein [Lentisphaerota bacterium]